MLEVARLILERTDLGRGPAQGFVAGFRPVSGQDRQAEEEEVEV